MTSQEKIEFVKREISEKAEISPSGSFFIELIEVLDLEATGGIPDEAPVLLSSKEQWSIIQKLKEEGFIQNVAKDENGIKVWMEFPRKKIRRSNLFSYIKTTDQLLQRRDLFAKFLEIIGGVNDIKPEHYYKTSTNEGNDDLIQLLIDLGLVDYDWNEMDKQTHRQVGNRLIEFGFAGNKILELNSRISGKNGKMRREALELISKEIGNRYTFNKIVRVFTDIGVPESMFIPDTKWRAVFYILSYYTTSSSNDDFQFALKILQEILHPLMFEGDEKKASEVQQNYRAWLKYDNVVVEDDGSVHPLGNKEKQIDKKKFDDDTFKQYLFQLRLSYSKILQVCDAFAGNYITFRNPSLNQLYIVLTCMVDDILEKDGFEEFRNERPELFEDLFGNIEDFDIEWEFGSKQAYSFLAKIEKAYILAGAPVYTLPQEIETFLEEADKRIAEHKKYCNEEWQKMLKRVDQHKAQETNQTIVENSKDTDLSRQKILNSLDEAIVRGFDSIFTNQPSASTQQAIQKVEIVGGKISIDGLRDERRNKFPYKLPAGTKWEDFTIKFEDKENIFVKVKHLKHHASFEEMGMVGKGKKPKPSESWTLLLVLAGLNGELTIKDAEQRDKYKKQKELLTKSLQDYFSLDYDPFYPYRQSFEKDGNSYKVKMTLIPPDTKKNNTKKAETDENEDDLGIREYLNEQAPLI